MTVDEVTELSNDDNLMNNKMYLKGMEKVRKMIQDSLNSKRLNFVESELNFMESEYLPHDYYVSAMKKTFGENAFGGDFGHAIKAKWFSPSWFANGDEIKKHQKELFDACDMQVTKNMLFKIELDEQRYKVVLIKTNGKLMVTKNDYQSDDYQSDGYQSDDYQ